MLPYPSWIFALVGPAVAAIIAGLLARRRRSAQITLAVLGPLYAFGLLAFMMVEGSYSTCTGGGTTLRCTEITYASTWGLVEWLAVAGVTSLSLVPLVALWLRTRIPSVAASVAIPVVIALYGLGLAAWMPAWFAVLAAAIAGPPALGAKETAGGGA